jgi:hypothetical protein
MKIILFTSLQELLKRIENYPREINTYKYKEKKNLENGLDNVFCCYCCCIMGYLVDGIGYKINCKYRK